MSDYDDDTMALLDALSTVSEDGEIEPWTTMGVYKEAETHKSRRWAHDKLDELAEAGEIMHKQSAQGINMWWMTSEQLAAQATRKSDGEGESK